MPEQARPVIGHATVHSARLATTDLLDRAIVRTRALSPEMQDEVARMLLLYAGESEPVIQLTPEEEADLAEGEAQVDRGKYATDDEVRAVLAKYRG